MAIKPAKFTRRGFQDILRALLGGNDEQFVGTLMKGYQVASHYKYQLHVKRLDDGKPW